MNAAPLTLAAKRNQLLATIARERTTLALSLQAWQQPLAVVDFARSLGQFVRRHPVAVALGVAALRWAVPKRLHGLRKGLGRGARVLAMFRAI